MKIFPGIRFLFMCLFFVLIVQVYPFHPLLRLPALLVDRGFPPHRERFAARPVLPGREWPLLRGVDKPRRGLGRFQSRDRTVGWVACRHEVMGRWYSHGINGPLVNMRVLNCLSASSEETLISMMLIRVATSIGVSDAHLSLPISHDYCQCGSSWSVLMENRNSPTGKV